MGVKNSKQKKEKKEKTKGSNMSPSVGKLKHKDKQSSSTEDLADLASSSEDNKLRIKADDGEDLELDPSWSDPVLFSNDGSKKIGKNDFEIMAVIGKGSFGKVLLVRKKDNRQIYAMKILRKEAVVARKQVAHTRAEKSILQRVQHPFIVKLHYAFQTEEKLYMVMDFVNGGELFYHLKRTGRFDEERVRFYAAEIVSALSHLHSLGIVYRDLKPENILLDAKGHVVITDFGLSKEINPEEGTTTFCGTPEYLAPEILRGKGHGCAVDWWSLGTMVYEMLTGLPPFYSKNVQVMFQKIVSADLMFPSHLDLSRDVQSLLQGLLTRDPEQRLGSIKNGQDIKEHPFFSSIDWQQLDRKELKAPFRPKVRGPADLSNIDPSFVAEEAEDSVVDSSALQNVSGGEFDGFTYVGDADGGFKG
ncbi:AGC protein kinase [Balamuthia mandrillaris]